MIDRTMLNRMSRLLLVLLLVTTAAFGAEEKAYKIVRPDGTIEFSDKPQTGATEIKVPPAQTYQAPALPPVTTPVVKSDQKPAAASFQYTELSIVSPTQDQTIHGGGGTIPVQIKLEPPLRSGDVVLVLLDGKSAARGANTAFTLQNVERGTHTLAAKVLDANDQTLLSSSSVTIHVFQYSKLFKKPSTPN